LGKQKKFQGEIVKGITNFRGLLVIFLIVALIAAGSVPVWGTGYADSGYAGIIAGTGEAAGGIALTEGSHKTYIYGYPDGSVKPIAPITREETAVIFYRLMSGEIPQGKENNNSTYYGKGLPFTDMEKNRWSYDEISALYHADILQGYEDNRFEPEQPITRAEFAAMAARFGALSGNSKSSLPEEKILPDIKNHWAVKSIDEAVAGGWIRVFGDGTFRPESGLLRCEAMMLINSALDRFVDSAGIVDGGRQFQDNPPSQWYYEIVMEAATPHDYQRADRPKSTERWIKINDF
jgi:hypothetical protein